MQNQGFRRYVVVNAQNLGITGFIYRTRHMDIQLTAEGTTAQLQNFFQWLDVCHSQGMYYGIVIGVPQTVPLRVYSNFSVRLDGSRPFHQEHCPDGVIRGSWSDNQHERLSQHSFNLYHGGHSRHSGSDSGSSSGYLRKGGGSQASSSSRKLQSAGLNTLG